MQTLLQSGQDTSAQFQAGRVVGMVVVVAIMLIIVVGVIKLIVKKVRGRN